MENKKKENLSRVPTFYTLLINGFLLFIVLIIGYINYQNLSKSRPYEIMMLLMILSIVFGLHGLIHLGLEYVYGFNPLKNI